MEDISAINAWRSEVAKSFPFKVEKYTPQIVPVRHIDGPAAKE